MTLKILIETAPVEQKPVLERLMQFYLYEFSSMEVFDANREGVFESKIPLDTYWSDPTRFPFLIDVDCKLAGFVLVNEYTCLPENKGAKSIAEFFVMGKYRRQGVGKHAAFHVFDMFPGRWEVRQIDPNVGGQKFWRSVINEYTGGNFTEVAADSESWRGPIQSFDNKGNSA